MAKTYCNITTDLTDVFDRIESYNIKYRLRQDFVVHAGVVFKKYSTGNIEKLFENSVALTKVSSVASINAASKWFYDGTNDILYLRASDDADPDTHIMERGFDWLVYKTRIRNEAMELLDSMLDARFERPLREARLYHTDGDYDIDIKRSCALLTCFLVISRAGDKKIADRLYKQVSDIDENGVGTGIVDLHNQRLRVFSFEVDAEELGHGAVEAASANTGDGMIEIKGLFLGDNDEIWRFQIDTAGAVGTATYKYSKNKGTSFQKTLQVTSNEWITLESGIWVRFFHRSGTFASGDIWDVYFTSERNREDIVYPTIKIQRG